MDFEDKVALVTGAAGSIGKGIAAHMIAEGAKVFVTDLDQTSLDAIAKELGEDCKALAADVTVHDQVKKVVEATTAAYGKIDVLINVAGVTGAGSAVEEIDEKTWDFVFDVNCKGTFLFIKEVVPLMKANGSGSIVNFSSKSGKTGSALMSAYSSAKAAIIGLTQALAFELAGNGVRVNCVCPGITEATGVWNNVSADYVKNMDMPIEEIAKKFTAKVPLGRLARIDDVVQMTCYLASEKASYMTGQAINITGGREMH
ncbi:Sorbitol dehydrogenase [Planctomycetes bacterium CA13]|uniref:Sorbitol dehydrogenase n=1 Tax=Novipirellula herctigrandis TaxID=2527986 RepID=A0A5C5Z0U8_9BACT|nr:Sorbitol dehydrogenase [Planctomycetes bacterium CA13]